MVFPLVIQTGTCASHRHLFISSASLSWMEVNFLNQNPCIPLCPSVFQFDIIFSGFFLVVRCVFSLWDLPRVLLVLLSYRLSIQPFRYTFSVAIFSSKIVRFIWRLVVGMFLYHALPVVDIIFFSLFWNVLFCLYCFTLCRSLINLTSFARTFCFFSSSCTVIFFRVVFCILFLHIPGYFCFTIFACFRKFFIWISCRISHPGFDCFFVLFEGTPIFSHTNFALA